MIRKIYPAVYGADNTLELCHMRMRDRLGRTADEDSGEIRQIMQMLAQPLEALRIEKRDLRARILQRIFEFRPRPPRIERRRDRASQNRAVKGSRPFRQIAHGDRHAVALLHAFLREAMRNHECGARKTFEGRAIVLIDEECPRREGGTAAQKYVA